MISFFLIIIMYHTIPGSVYFLLYLFLRNPDLSKDELQHLSKIQNWWVIFIIITASNNNNNYYKLPKHPTGKGDGVNFKVRHKIDISFQLKESPWNNCARQLKTPQVPLKTEKPQ